ncbi:hypothetical protein [Olivibacter sp. LS-1]|uniref:hypothetical protein n=1 Tax=Olivibacter sp. LS-1 TaxID=2592345 RepID=UPI00143E08C9|nr:hypothetical protein [Olivibacter sp. LS-1]
MGYFELPEVIFIGILEFKMDDAERERYLKSIQQSMNGHTKVRVPAMDLLVE